MSDFETLMGASKEWVREVGCDPELGAELICESF